MLKRYWLVIYPKDRFGSRNIGLTALSIVQAKLLAKNSLPKLKWEQITEEDIDNAEIIENINIQHLDQDHVVPNMGVVSRKGIWFPNCNS